ncbi:MAG: radical SAM protein [Treponema sp.]|nr:radical SAM protein [Treponema sp.]
MGNLDKLSDDWKNIDTIVLYGAGIVGHICQHLFEKVDVHIPFIIDSDVKKQGTTWNGIPIISFDEASNKLEGKKIVIMTAHTAYNEISAFLEERGFKEYVDFCGIGQFICEWFWKARGMNCLYHVDMTITTRCTFRCRHCNMFIPYYEKQRDCSFEEIKENVDLLFSRVDYLVYFALLGGEPTLNPDLGRILEYIGKNYRDKCGRLAYVINGSITPSDEVLAIMKKYDTHLLISDYTEFIPYKPQLGKLIQKLDDYGLLYDVRYSQIWADFGFPSSLVKRTPEQLKEHLRCCHPEWNGLNDGKFYYCNISWSAEKSGHFKLKDSDYIVLKDIDPDDKTACRQIVELSRGTSSFCRICGGCGKDNTNYVPVGEQLKSPGGGA